ncbi:GNAT family N-acetyltransferase [Candidatus Woesearchaeota archaeon]|nr:GNAT family N-acetyltransferase [Candidatus Woesearchaeota archaeon]
MEIHEVTSVDDCRKLVPLFIKVFSEPPYEEAWSEEKAEKRIVETWLRGTGFNFFAKEDDVIIGMILCVTQSWEDGDHLIIEDCVVDSSLRGKGIGKELVFYLESVAISKGIVSIEGLVNKDAPAVHFWNKLGYPANGYFQIRKIL